MKCFGEKIKKLRIESNLPLRKVAAYLDIDTSILSKIERGERAANREIVTRAAQFFDLNEEESLISFYGDQVANILYKEDNCSNILKVAEEKIKYIKTQSLEQGEIGFDKNE
jgi:transcriptional regulator with XRE-family HTH domain